MPADLKHCVHHTICKIKNCIILHRLCCKCLTGSFHRVSCRYCSYCWQNASLLSNTSTNGHLPSLQVTASDYSWKEIESNKRPASFGIFCIAECSMRVLSGAYKYLWNFKSTEGATRCWSQQNLRESHWRKTAILPWYTWAILASCHPDSLQKCCAAISDAQDSVGPLGV